MTTINLHQDQQDEQISASKKVSMQGFLFSLGIVVITIAVYFGLQYYIPVLEKRNNDLATNITDENSKLVGLKSLEKLIDIQNRVKEIKSNLQPDASGNVARLTMTNVMDHVANDLVTGVTVSEFTYNDKGVTVSFDASNFDDIAKQILYFKKSTYFTGASVSSIKRGDKGINCVVVMNIK